MEEKVERRALCFADLAEERGYDRSVGREVAEAYNTIRDYGNVQFIPGIEGTLDQLAESYHLGLVTNGEPAMQGPKLAALEIADLFEVIVYAGIDTLAKPASEPFAVALASLDVRPNETVYVGNSLESDIEGANEAGLSSVWMPYDSPDDSELKPDAPVPDYRTNSAKALGPQLWTQSSPVSE
jgi:HAD superfamily hydrolase (TIGR01549 family)